MTVTPVVVGPANAGEGEAPSWRLIPALLIAPVFIAAPYLGSSATLIPARLSLIDPDGKALLVTVVSIAGALSAMVASVCVGAASDATSRRFGRRSPWMMLGALVCGGSLLSIAATDSVAVLVGCWCVFQLGLNAMMVTVIAVIADRIPQRRRGFFSALYGVGIVIGGGTGQIVAGKLIEHQQLGFYVFAGLSTAAGVLFVTLAPDRLTRSMTIAPQQIRRLRHHFSLPREGARDLYFALGAKLLHVVATFTISAYHIYIFTDYIGLDLAAAGDVDAQMALINVPISIIIGFTVATWSDRIGRRKIFVMGAAGIAAAGTVVQFLFSEVWAMFVFTAILATATGAFTSVDQALNTEVLPSRENAARDLGILNMASSVGGILGPAVASTVIMATGSYRALFPVACIALLMAAALIMPIRRVR